MKIEQRVIRFTSSMVALAGFLIVTGVSTPAHAQWGVTDLNPDGAGEESVAYGGSDMQVVGYAITISNVFAHHAALWGVGGTFVDLNPAGATSSEASGITSGAPGQQVG